MPVKVALNCLEPTHFDWSHDLTKQGKDKDATPPTNPESPASLSDAIAKLESIGNSGLNDFKERMTSDLGQVKNVLNQFKPQVENLIDDAREKKTELSGEIAKQVQENPLLVLGCATLVGLFIGWLLGRNTKQ
jgi:ElaB/YqjD/DUF883 family membrane-anchored ribosome-binding protein